MRYTVFDVETPNHNNDRMSSIGIVVMEDDRIVSTFTSMINPEVHFDPFNIALTGITPEMAACAPTFGQLWPKIRPLMENAVLVAHNAQFDMAVLAKCLRVYDIFWKRTVPYICTCKMSRSCLPHLENHKLNTLCDHYRLELDHHRADSDAMACAQILQRLSGTDVRHCYLRQYDLLAAKTLR